MPSRNGRASATAAATEPAQPALQVPDHGFNIFGWWMKITDQFSNADEIITLNAYEPSSRSWEKAVPSIVAKGQQVWKSPLALTAREQDIEMEGDDEAGTSRYLLVGFTLRGLQPDHLRKHPSQKKQKAVGVELNPAAVIDSPDLPIMVVTRLHQPESEGSGTPLYALIGPKDGLCVPHHVGQKACFYLPQFRDNTTDLKHRGPAWNQLVQSKCVRPARGAPAAPSAEPEISAEAQPMPRVVQDQTRSAKREISMLLGSFMEHGETWHLREIQRVLDEMDEDLADGVPFIPCPALRKFMEIDDPNWDDQDSVRLLSEFFDRWPDTRSFCELRTTDVNLIKRQIVEDRLSIEFRLLRPFILNCKMLISSQGSDTNPQPGKICAIALKLTNNMLRHVALMMPISPEYDTKLLLAVKSALGRALVKARKVDRENPHNVDDPIWEELTLDELFDKHAVALEVGVVKLLFTHAVQQLATAYRHRDRGICSMLEDVVEIEASGFLRQAS